MKPQTLIIAALAVASALRDCPAQRKPAAGFKDSVVLIRATQRAPRLLEPWRKRDAELVTGSGFVMEGKRILTNAHVVAYASDVYVKTTQWREPREAVVEKISLEFDLAVLKIKESKKPVKLPPALKLAKKLPGVGNVAIAYGFQNNGVNVAQTRGQVSRIEYGDYNFDGAGLRLEITAQLAGGNSGGPVMSGGEVVGIVHAVSPQGNIGYAIPVEEITAFLKAPPGTRDFGKPGIQDDADIHALVNPALRAKLNVPEKVTGVLVGELDTKDPAYPLKPGDIITRVGQHEIDNRGQVRVHGTQLGCAYLIAKLARDGKTPLTVWRGGKTWRMNVPVRKTYDGALIRPLKGRQPSYFVWGPLAFTSAHSELVDGIGDYLSGYWIARKSPLATRRFDRVAFPGEELVLVVNAFHHKTLLGYARPVGQVVSRVNGTKIKNLRHLVETLCNARGPFVEFEFADKHVAKVVFDHKAVTAANDKILEDNGIRRRASPKSLLAVWKK